MTIIVIRDDSDKCNVCIYQHTFIENLHLDVTHGARQGGACMQGTVIALTASYIDADIWFKHDILIQHII